MTFPTWYLDYLSNPLQIGVPVLAVTAWLVPVAGGGALPYPFYDSDPE